MKTTNTMKILGLSLFALLICSSAFAANHYIRKGATGAANGNNWTDAYTDIPATLARGDTYYIASGSYGSHTFSPLSGTSYVYLKKATESVNGSDPGWNSNYGTGEALFSASGTVWTINMAYLDVDGVTGTGTSQHGIHLSSGATSDGVGCITVPYGVDPPQSHVWIRHLEMNNAPWGNCNSSRVVYHNSSTTTDWNFQYCYIHGGRVGIGFVAGGSTQNLIEYCVLKDIGSDCAEQHCTMINMASANNTTIRYNVLWNMQGSANTTYIEPQFDGSGCYVYGNVFREDPGVTGTGQGIFALTSSDVWTDCRIYNNTIYGLHTTAGLIWGGNVTGSKLYINNNIVQNCSGATSFYDPGGTIVAANNIINTGVVSFQNAAGGDFHLSAPTQNGSVLPAPYDKDPDGNTRGAGGVWDIGAYEYGPLNTNPVVSVSPTSLNFGSVVTNTSRDLSFTVKNVGGGTLAGSVMSMAPPFSIVSGATYSLGANQTNSVTVRYSPIVAGSSSTNVTFIGGGGVTAPVTGAATTIAANSPPTVSTISQNAPDVDLALPGLQVFEGTVVQYSGSASDPNGDPLTWQWIYTVNGGGEVVYQSGTGTVTLASFSYVAGTAGKTYVWKLRANDGVATAEAQLTVGVKAPPAIGGGLSFEAEAGVLSIPFVSANGSISQPSTTDLAGGGRAVYNFTVTNAGDYAIQALVNAPSLTENSFYVNIDAEPQDPAMAWDILPPSVGFENRLVSWRGSGTADANELVPKFFTLSLGSHQLIIRGREANGQLDRFVILKRLLPPPAPQVVNP